MAQFRPIATADDLPKPGDAETNVLDFKGTILGDDGKPDLRELAKDVAAFANADGGTLLYRAYEDGKRAVLGKYDPLTPEQAKEAREAYSNAIAQFCDPKPIASVEQAIPFEGGLIIAVNVWPYTAGLIGVRATERVDAYFFPWRASLQTICLHVEQLPMFMSPDVRRKAILLRSISTDDTVLVKLRYTTGAASSGEPLLFKRVDEPSNAVVFWSRSESAERVYPLDQVRTVYKDNSRWIAVFEQWG